MSARVIDGKAVAARIRDEVAGEGDGLGVKTGLATVPRSTAHPAMTSNRSRVRGHFSVSASH